MTIRMKSILVIGFLGLLATVAVASFSYRFSVATALEDAKGKGKIIIDYVNSTRKFFKDKQRPLIFKHVGKDRFYPEIMSGFVVTRGVYEYFQNFAPEYEFKQATIDPLWAPNTATAEELEIINVFKDHPELERLENTVKRYQKDYYYLAFPVKVDNKKCLRCHGNPKDAPKDQINLYGAKNGYNWTLGDIVSTMIVYIPIDKALTAAKDSALKLFGIVAGAFIFTILCIWFFLDRGVVSPILLLSKRAEELSLGKNLNQGIESKSKDEVGRLSNAIERLRVSLVLLMKRR